MSGYASTLRLEQPPLSFAHRSYIRRWSRLQLLAAFCLTEVLTMSENSNNQQPEIGKLKIICPRCSQHFSTKLPAYEVANNFKVSILTFSHERPIRCVGCHQAFLLMLTPAEHLLSVYAQPVPDEAIAEVEEKRIIVPDMAHPPLKLM